MFFDIAAHGEPLDHVSFKVFVDKIPKTAENFHSLSTGEKEFGYKGSHFHRNILGLMCQCGDFTHYNGTGGRSIYGKKFDENFILKHTGPLASCPWQMLDQTHGSQVFICSAKTQGLDGMDVVTAMECSGSMNGKTSKITITDCGQLS